MRTMILLLLLWTPRIAAAGDDAGVIVTGESTLQPQLVAQIEDWLAHHGHKVVAAPMPVDAINSTIDCFVIDGGGDGCARGVVDARARTEVLVFAKVDVAPTGDGMRDITVIAYWFQKGQEVTARKRTCERCTEQTLRSETDALMTELALSRQHGSGLLRVSSEPPGATVIVDKERVGVTPLDYNLTPGNHQVTLMLDRHETEQRKVAIRVGDTTPLNVPMTPIRDGGRPRWLRPLPLALAVGGLACAGAGAYWIITDEDDSPTGPLVIHDTASRGAAVLGVGAVALAASAWLFLRDSDSGPVVSASRGGGYVGWTTNF